MRRSYVFKARLSKGAAVRADRQLQLCRELYNAALEERVTAWKRARVSRSFPDQCRELTGVRKVRPEFADLDRMMLENVLRRVDLAFHAFFRRVQAGQKPGHPRFRGRGRYDSMTYRLTGWKQDGQHLTLRGIGRLKLFLSRPVEGAIKTVTLKRDACGDWFVVFACDGVAVRPLPDTGRAVGIDLGLTAFIATSDGETIQHPRAYRAAERRLSRAQRRRAKMRRGGTRHREHSRTIAAVHRRAARIRRDHRHKAALALVRRYDLIAAEDMNVAGLARMRLAKSVHDAGWGQFLDVLAGAAESANRTLVLVDPRGTSQVCSGCGHQPAERKTLADRVHECRACGLVLDRDHNAALNVLQRGRAALAASGRRSQAAA